MAANPDSGAFAARILVVEDDAHIADGLRFNLEAEGYSVEVVSDGRTAVERISDAEAPRLDLVVLDLMLPELSGFEVARRTRMTATLRS